MTCAGIDNARARSIMGLMSEKMNETDDMEQQTPCDADDCCCKDKEQTAQEYAEAVDESNPAEAEAATDDLTKWRELAMRTAAEYDNYRKRCVKEREEFTRYANRGLLEELLPVIDNFEMGMMMAEKETSSMIYIGMSMVQKQLLDFLSSQGVEAISTEVGQAFDHNIHEAIQSEPSDQPEGTILRIIRKGYNLKGRLLRPANVIVAAAAEDKA